MTRSAFIHVQHLLGTGHVFRAAAIGHALAARGIEVTLATGNTLPPLLDTAGLTVVELPPVRALDARFKTFLTPDGREIDDTWKAARRDATLAAFAARDFDLVLTETWPFGRRPFAFEMEPLVAAAQARARPPLIAASIRDILVRKQEIRKEEEMAERALAAYDIVLVHSDPEFVKLEDSFPFTERIAHLLRYTGFAETGNGSVPAPGAEGQDEVIVSCGGGAVGAGLLAAAIPARALSHSAGDCTWRLLAGHDIDPETFDSLRAQAGDGLIVERARRDFTALLARARLSVSQAGYNTVLDILRAGVPSVLVPFAQIKETEQQQRADALARHGRAVSIPEKTLTPASLAAAVDAAIALPRRRIEVQLGGAERAAEILAEALEARG
ncbi:glycosyltransferase family protein [Stappia sp.]|uniref:glycosyltransferase family protein n=1 Tax=Stappia sp. TaxID=1870903 RepID=UPI003A9A580E